MPTPAATAAFSSGSNWRGGGTGWRLSRAWAGKCFKMCSATVMLASSIISSTIWLASRTWYMPTSRGSCVSVSISNLTSGDAKVKAPLLQFSEVGKVSRTTYNLQSDLQHLLLQRFMGGKAINGCAQRPWVTTPKKPSLPPPQRPAPGPLPPCINGSTKRRLVARLGYI